jgi:photosystem II stability/assembly factor-like uncharacterized protein
VGGVFPDPNDSGIFLRTTNGGSTWTKQPGESSGDFITGVSFVNATTGFVSAGHYAGQTGSGYVRWTTDGGASWSSFGSTALYGVSCTDSSTATAVGDSPIIGVNSIILRTTDGGNAWTYQLSGTFATLRGVSFTDANTGTVVGDGGTILRTTDGGTSWTIESSGTTNPLHGVSFTDANTGTAVGSEGIILRTTDGGTTWAQQSSGTSADLYGVRFTDANTGTIVGSNGTILRTTTGGVESSLAVQLTNFAATVLSQNNIELNWTTLSETNNYGFYVERRKDNELIYEEIPNSFIPGHGTTIEEQHYSYTDTTAASGLWYYRLKQTDLDGYASYSQPIRVDVATGVTEQSFPKEFILNQNYPNPFNPTTIIRYSLPVNSHVTLKIYDLLGHEVETLVDAEKQPGVYSVSLDANNLEKGMSAKGGHGSGIYFYRLNTGNFVETRKMVLMK